MKKTALMFSMVAVFAFGANFKDGIKSYDRHDYQKAKIIFEELAKQGNAKAQIYFGIMYLNGQGVEKNKAKAMEWVRKAAENGNGTAQAILGTLFEGMSDTKAAEWYEKAAKQGVAEAQFKLGVMYDKGQGVKQDYAKAVEWLEKAAKQGHIKAQANLGLIYETGSNGVKQNYAKAAEWYEKAAEQGYPLAQLQIGTMYENGQGVKQDYAKAVKWYKKASAQGMTMGAMLINKLCGQHPEVCKQ